MMKRLTSSSLIRRFKSFCRILVYLILIWTVFMTARFFGESPESAHLDHSDVVVNSVNKETIVEIQETGENKQNTTVDSIAPNTLNDPVQDTTIPPASETLISISELKPSWKFLHGQAGDRDAMIELHHACINLDGGLFLPIVDNQNIDDPPAINIGGSDKSLDVMIRVPQLDMDRQVKATLVSKERPLFTLGGIWPYHLSHWFVNNLTPLVNVMNYYYKSKTNWLTAQRDLFQAGDRSAFDAKTLNFTHIYKQSEVIDQIRCYDRVVLGLNSTCDCCGCLKDYEDRTIYAQVREMVLKTHLSSEDFNQAINRTQSLIKDRPFHVVIVQRKSSRRILNLGQVQEYLTSKKISHEVVELEGYSFADQVRLFSLNATCIIAAHGNAIGNAWWLPPASLLIEIHSYQSGSLWFEHIWSDASTEMDQAMLNSDWKTPNSKSLAPHGHKLHYYKIHCQSAECQSLPMGFNADTHVELTKLDVILDNYFVWNGIPTDG